MKHAFTTRGHSWRVQSDERGRFDEIVVTVGTPTTVGRRGGLMLHAEMMDDQSMFVDVGGFCIWVYADKDGNARITMNEDRRSWPVAVDLRDPNLDSKRRPTGGRR